MKYIFRNHKTPKNVFAEAYKIKMLMYSKSRGYRNVYLPQAYFFIDKTIVIDRMLHFTI